MFRKLLLACDGSPLSVSAARQGLVLALRLAAEVVVLYVIGADISDLPAVARGEDLVRQHHREGEEILVRLQDEGQRMGVSVRALIREGPAAEEILNTARGEGCDLIIMGTHGRSGLVRLLMGSIAESVLREAPCPVLLFRSH